jgi:hypothetical protein
MVVDGQITKNQFLTKSTTEGLRVTILSTIYYYLLSCGFHYILSNKFNQSGSDRGNLRNVGTVGSTEFRTPISMLFKKTI